MSVNKSSAVRDTQQRNFAGQNQSIQTSAYLAYKKGYFWLGLFLFTAFTIQEFMHLNWPGLAKLQTDSIYKQATGFILVAYFIHQWRCSLQRNKGMTQNASKVLLQHKWLGALAPLLFYLHSQHIGYAYLQTLSVFFFAIFLTGLFNTEITHIHKISFHNIWILVHVGLATGLVFLIGYHIVISYSYQ